MQLRRQLAEVELVRIRHRIAESETVLSELIVSLSSALVERLPLYPAASRRALDMESRIDGLRRDYASSLAGFIGSEIRSALIEQLSVAEKRSQLRARATAELLEILCCSKSDSLRQGEDG